MNSQALIIGCPLDPATIKWAEIPEIYTVAEAYKRISWFHATYSAVGLDKASFLHVIITHWLSTSPFFINFRCVYDEEHDRLRFKYYNFPITSF